MFLKRIDYQLMVMKLELSMSAIKQLMKVKMNVIKMIVNQFILKQKLIITLDQK